MATFVGLILDTSAYTLSGDVAATTPDVVPGALLDEVSLIPGDTSSKTPGVLPGSLLDDATEIDSGDTAAHTPSSINGQLTG